MRLLSPVLGRLFGVLGSLAARGVVASLSRTAVAIAALAVAVSATVGVGIMVESFRDTVTHWLKHTLRADLYVSLREEVSDGITLDPALVRRLAAAPGVASHSTSRRVQIESSEGLTYLVALSIGPPAYPAFRFKEGEPRSIWPAFQDGGAVIVSESYAYRRDLHVGSRVRLRTDRGERAFPVAGIYYAYATDQGVVTMSRKTYDRFWDDPGITGMGIYAAPGTDLDSLKDRLLRLAGTEQGIEISANRAILELSLAIFDRTFAITEVLRLLAGLVAFLGVLSALMALQLERTRELGVLRANGLTPGQLGGLIGAQTGLMGLAAGLIALPLGVVMALVLILVINRRSFGWTLEVQVPPEALIGGLVLALVAALLAGVYPALRMARTSPAEALREE
jgi:putative ABC transport system permease protein